MGDLFLFLSVLYIVFGILQIFLFFKLWGMTNNVKKLKEWLLHSNYHNEVRKYILFGDKEKARELIMNKFVERICGTNDIYFSDAKKMLAQELSVIGCDVPEEINKLESRTDFHLLFQESTWPPAMNESLPYKESWKSS